MQAKAQMDWRCSLEKCRHGLADVSLVQKLFNSTTVFIHNK